MGDRTPGGRGVQGVVFIPPSRGRPAEIVGIVTPRQGESIQDAMARSGLPTRGTRMIPYQPVTGGRLRDGEVDISDLGLSSRQLTRNSVPTTAAGLRSISADFVQGARRSVADRRSAQAAGRENVLSEANALRRRVLRQTRGQSLRRRQGAMRRAGLPSRGVQAPFTVADVNRGRIR